MLFKKTARPASNVSWKQPQVGAGLQAGRQRPEDERVNSCEEDWTEQCPTELSSAVSSGRTGRSLNLCAWKAISSIAIYVLDAT